MAGTKILRSLSFFLLLTLISYFSESAFTGSLTTAGLTFTIPTLSTLTQTQLIYLTAGGLSKSQHQALSLCNYFSALCRSWCGCRSGRSCCGLKSPGGYWQF